MEKNIKLMTNVVPLAIFIVGLVVIVIICWVTWDSNYVVVKTVDDTGTMPVNQPSRFSERLGSGSNDDDILRIAAGMERNLFVHSDDEDAVFKEGMHETITVGDLTMLLWLKDTNAQTRNTNAILKQLRLILICSFLVWCVQQIALYLRLQFSFQVRK